MNSQEGNQVWDFIVNNIDTVDKADQYLTQILQEIDQILGETCQDAYALYKKMGEYSKLIKKSHQHLSCWANVFQTFHDLKIDQLQDSESENSDLLNESVTETVDIEEKENINIQTPLKTVIPRTPYKKDNQSLLHKILKSGATPKMNASPQSNSTMSFLCSPPATMAFVRSAKHIQSPMSDISMLSTPINAQSVSGHKFHTPSPAFSANSANVGNDSFIVRTDQRIKSFRRISDSASDIDPLDLTMDSEDLNYKANESVVISHK